MKSSLSFVSETAAQKKEVILRAASSKPKDVPVSRSGRRVEQTIRDEDLIFIYQNAKSHWVETEESLFALKYRGADRDCRSGVVSQSLAVHILEDQIGSENSAEHDTLETITLALTKAYQYALMYPTLKFAMSELGFPKGFEIKKDEVIFNLKSAPSNLILSGEWQNIREKQLGLKKSARLVISGTALGVNNSFVYEEIEEEIAYLRDEGFTEITLFHFFADQRSFFVPSRRIWTNSIAARLIRGSRFFQFVCSHLDRIDGGLFGVCHLWPWSWNGDICFLVNFHIRHFWSVCI